MGKKLGEKTPGKTGRPALKRDWPLIERLFARGARLPEVAYVTGISKASLENWIREDFDMTVSQFRDLHMTPRKLKILDKQFEIAMAGDARLLIHLGEHECGQVPKQQNLNVNASVEDYLKNMGGNLED